MTAVHSATAWSKQAERFLRSQPWIQFLAWRVSVFVIGVFLRTLVGALAGWIVGWFFGGTLVAVAAPLLVLHKVAIWQLGAALGFVAGFFDPRFFDPKE